jgi:predicted enzyme related to lactoylglutathione lyase
MSAEANHGRFVWFDLMTTKPAAAIDFYTRLVGWGTQVWTGLDTPYTMLANGEAPFGGVMELPMEAHAAGAAPHWLAYVAVADVDRTVERAVQLGGSAFHAPTDIPSVGRFAVIRDPQGAMIAIYRSANANAEPASAQPAAGDFCWHELATTDHRAACDFYAALFGWEKHEAMDMGEAGVYQIYGRSGQPLGGMFDKPCEMPGPPAWLSYITVPDVRTAVGRVAELGGQVLNGPMEVPGGLIAQCLDPQGAMFALHSSAT